MKKIFLGLTLALVSMSASSSLAASTIYQCGPLQLVSHISDPNYERDFLEISGVLNGQKIHLYDEDFKMKQDRSENIPTIVEILGVKQIPALKCYYSQSFPGQW